jgi:hypothetical protein
MAKRPQISDELHKEVKNIYKQVRGREASDFEEALELVLQFADYELSEPGNDEGWYLGKYVGEGLDYLAKRRLNRGRNNTEADRTTHEQVNFKTIVEDPEHVEVPKAEVIANNLQQGDLLYVTLERMQKPSQENSD